MACSRSDCREPRSATTASAFTRERCQSGHGSCQRESGRASTLRRPRGDRLPRLPLTLRSVGFRAVRAAPAQGSSGSIASVSSPATLARFTPRSGRPLAQRRVRFRARSGPQCGLKEQDRGETGIVPSAVRLVGHYAIQFAEELPPHAERAFTHSPPQLYDNPTFFGPKLSPDGRCISWLAPVDGVLNIWMSPANDVKAGEPVTRTKGRPINWHDWTADGRFLMFLNDETGDENHHLFIADPVSHAIRDLTPLRQHRHCAEFVVARCTGRGRRQDQRPRSALARSLSIDLTTGQRTLIWENTQELGHIGLDWQLRPRYARSNTPDGGSKQWRIEGTTLRLWRDVPYEDSLTTGVNHFDRSNERALLFTSIGRDTAACFWHDWATGHETLVAAHPKADCSQVEPASNNLRGRGRVSCRRSAGMGPCCHAT